MLQPELVKYREENLKSDAKVRFYTGMPTLQSFNTLTKALHPKTNRVKYWKGPTFHCNTLRHTVFREQRSDRKLSMKEEILVTLMKFRLGL